MSLTKWKKDDLIPTFNGLWDDFISTNFFNRSLELGTTIPAANILESDATYNLELAIPGFKKDDFVLDVDNNILSVSSEQKEESEEKNGERVTKKEFSYSSFKRTFTLPENVDRENIEAVYENGILKIAIPKLELSKAETRKHIPVS